MLRGRRKAEKPRPADWLRVVIPVVLIAALLVVARKLGYFAITAASFASWQLTQQAKNSLLTTTITSLAFTASSVNPRDLESI